MHSISLIIISFRTYSILLEYFYKLSTSFQDISQTDALYLFTFFAQSFKFYFHACPNKPVQSYMIDCNLLTLFLFPLLFSFFIILLHNLLLNLKLSTSHWDIIGIFSLQHFLQIS